MRVPGGYIELQINGGWGHHFSDDPSSIWAVGERLVDHGVTAFLPTLVSDGFERLPDAIEVLAAGPPAEWFGAAPLGWHVEGPFLHPDRAGAHRRSALAPITEENLALLARDNGIRLVTLAPELDGSHNAIERLVERGVTVSLGHTTATYVEAERAIDAGATMGTHLFNAMSGLHHREPGMAAALLTDDRVAVGLIADGHHVDPVMVDLAWRAAAERIVLVSDAVSVMGTTTEPVATLSDGTLSGSTIGIDQCVRYVMQFAECSLEEAVAAASARPAAVIGHEPTVGDWTELDEAGVVLRTSIGGRVTETTARMHPDR